MKSKQTFILEVDANYEDLRFGSNRSIRFKIFKIIEFNCVILQNFRFADGGSNWDTSRDVVLVSVVSLLCSLSRSP